MQSIPLPSARRVQELERTALRGTSGAAKAEAEAQSALRQRVAALEAENAALQRTAEREALGQRTRSGETLPCNSLGGGAPAAGQNGAATGP